jgi:single-strand selective monofunctional uracil DNA glycosylase
MRCGVANYTVLAERFFMTYHLRVVMGVTESAKKLSKSCDSLSISILKQKNISYVTNPLNYAWEYHESYLTQYSTLGAKTLLLGMNPGPYGMAQCGVPFGATHIARDFLNITGEFTEPVGRHPKRPIEGLDFERQEISGTRMWGLLGDIWKTPENIHKNVFLVNHCPLLLLGDSGKNITPDKISGLVAKKLLKVCDEHLREIVIEMGITKVIGIGKYAEKRALLALKGLDLDITTCWHPSPASPLANRNDGADWQANVRNVLLGEH